MLIAGFNRQLFYGLIAAFVLDQIAILGGMIMFDLILRPIILALLIAQGVLWVRAGSARPAYLLILAGLIVAIPNEVIQRFYGMGGQAIAGTAVYYGLFFLGFALLRLVPYSWKIALPFLGLAAYMGIFYLILDPGLYRQEALSYMGVTLFMLGFAFYPMIVRSDLPAARILALGGLLLLVSDTLRAYVFLRMGFYSGTFWVDNFAEAVIVGLFFSGHFCVVQVMKPEQRT